MVHIMCSTCVEDHHYKNHPATAKMTAQVHSCPYIACHDSSNFDGKSTAILCCQTTGYGLRTRSLVDTDCRKGGLWFLLPKLKTDCFPARLLKHNWNLVFHGRHILPLPPPCRCSSWLPHGSLFVSCCSSRGSRCKCVAVAQRRLLSIAARIRVSIVRAVAALLHAQATTMASIQCARYHPQVATG